ncbi:MAG: pyrroloquinoline quinone biosynthesis peptide chaperone PqqD [Motiliproteus sp.]
MLALNSIPSINRHFRLQWEPAQGAYVLLYPEGMVKLNPSASEVLNVCDGKTDIAGIISALDKKFPEAGGVSADVIDFLEDAHGKHWIEFQQ